MQNEKFHFQPIPDTDGITKVVEFKPSDLKIPPRHREVADVDSFARYLTKWADKERAVVYCHNGHVTAILDEVDNYHTLTLNLERPRVFELWAPLLKQGRQLGHKAFKDFLEDRFHEIEGGEDLFAKISTLSLAQTFTYNSKLSNERQYSIAVEADDSASITKIPRLLNVTIPVWEAFLNAYDFGVKLIFLAPNEQRKEPVFAFQCEAFDDVLRTADNDVILSIEAALEGWQVLNGAPAAQ